MRIYNDELNEADDISEKEKHRQRDKGISDIITMQCIICIVILLAAFILNFLSAELSDEIKHTLNELSGAAAPNWVEYLLSLCSD